MGAEQISVGDAMDRLLTVFSARGWRDDGSAARAVVAAATRIPGEADLDRLVRALPRPFLRNNAIARKEARAAIGAALAGAQVRGPVQSDVRTRVTINTTNNQRITIQSSGPWAGNVGGGGDILGVNQTQQQVMGDAAVEALAAQYGNRPEVRQIIEASAPLDRQPRVAAWLHGVGGVAEDLAAKVAAQLIRGYTGG